MDQENSNCFINCACVIHGDAYGWEYVDRLYNMLSCNLTTKIRLHVFTEADRSVPEPYIKHALVDWGIGGPKQAWWYKLQLFNTEIYQGPLLYFDLDVVIVDTIDWITKLSLDYFWTVRDFKYLWKEHSYTINSSIMWFDTNRYQHVWLDFISREINTTLRKYRGDQDYLSEIINQDRCRFLEQDRVKSWRWQCLDGGYNFVKKQHISPGVGTTFAHPTSVLVFHGKPKPDQIKDPVILQHWK